jgi:hypothetical protein
MSDPVTIPFPADLDAWPQAFIDFQTAQVETVSPELAPVVSPSAPTIAPAVPVAFSSAGNQVAGSARTIW